jgi:hypothetical protein
MIKKCFLILSLAAALTGFTFGSTGIHVRFDDINGLVAGDRVVFDGATMGKVKKIKYGDDGIFTVSLSINNDFKDFLTEYSRFTITDDPRDNGGKAVEMLLIHMGGAPLKNGSSVDGSGQYQVLLEMMKDDARQGIEYLNNEFKRFSEDLKSLSEHEQVKELEKQIARLGQELKKASRETKEKIISDIIPKLEEEVAALRKRLEAMGREEEVEPLEKELEKIKYI